jgi:hypothetical protein
VEELVLLRVSVGETVLEETVLEETLLVETGDTAQGGALP